MDKIQNLPKAIVNGSEKIRGVRLNGAVLDDIYRTRVFSERSLSNAFGFKGSGQYWTDRKNNASVLPPYLYTKKVKEFVSKELEELLSASISYISVSGKLSEGLTANTLPKICDVFIKAAKKYPEEQKIVVAAEAAYEIIMAFSEYGVISWVDRITGYKYEEEDHVILQQLALYVAPDILE